MAALPPSLDVRGGRYDSRGVPGARHRGRPGCLLQCRGDGPPLPARNGRRGRPDGVVSLTTGRGPLSARPAGRFTAPVPAPVTYLEPHRRRVRGIKDGMTVIDSERALLVHRPGGT